MSILGDYIFKVIGETFQEEDAPEMFYANLPMFIRETYNLKSATLLSRSLIIMEPKDLDKFIIGALLKHFAMVQSNSENLVVLLLPSISSIQRKRLIDKKVDFIVPEKQLFLPSLLLNLKEEYSGSTFHSQRSSLLPSAQFLLIYHLRFSSTSYSLAEYSLKQVAKETGYTPMAITKAAKDLERFELIEILGTKEKFISFNFEKKELWEKAENMELLRSPVLKRIFVDQVPAGVTLLPSYFSALGEYSDISPGNQNYIAVNKTIYQKLEKSKSFVNMNSEEGPYCMEVWSYNPNGLTFSSESYVDPLSLYLSLRDSGDERIDMACEQIIDRYSW